MQELREEVLVFDQGWWQKNKELYDNIQKAEWEDVILDDEKKQSIVDDVFGFFDGEGKYKDFGVPWKVSFSILLGNSSINHRPERYHILRSTGCKYSPAPYSIHFLTSN